MKLGFVSAILPELSLEELFAWAAREGFACVELMCWPPGPPDRRYAGVTHLDVTDFGALEAGRVRQLQARYGLAISALGYYPNPLAADAAEAALAGAHLRKVITAAARLEVPVVNTFVGRDPHLSVDANWPRLREVWTGMVAAAESAQVRLAIENCPMLFTDDEWPGGKNLASTPAVWRRLFEEFPSPSLGLNYDPSHLVWQQIDHIRPIAEFAQRIFHFHAKDCRLDRTRLAEVGVLAPPLHYHQPKLPGLGDVEWARVFATLRDTGYHGPVCIEVEDRAYESSREAREDALRRSARFLRPFLA